MKTDDVKKLQRLEVEIAELIIDTHPQGKAEWDAFNKMVDAHKNLMKIDTDSLLQLPLPLEPKKKAKSTVRKDCPRCRGTGQWRDPDAPDKAPRPCNCYLVEDVAWPGIKQEWEQQLAPVKA